MLTKRLPTVIAISMGLLTLIGLLFSAPAINRITLTWGAILAAIALLFGVFNLFIVHIRRLLNERNLYSGVLIISMLLVFIGALADELGMDLVGGSTVNYLFQNVQLPLESALASLLAFFLLFAIVNLLRRRRSLKTVLFLLTVIFALIGSVLPRLSIIPESASSLIATISTVIDTVVVASGVRGLILGIALGTVMLSIRLLLGMERPYNK
ncbi:MAG: hypothetical protein AAF490_03590 [Chloroflexota bacterium]